MAILIALLDLRTCWPARPAHSRWPMNRRLISVHRVALLAAAVLLAACETPTAPGVNIDIDIGEPQFGHVSASAWTTVAPMPTARNAAGAATGDDGRVYLSGGNLGPGPSAAHEAYDPVAGTWTSVASLPAPRFGHISATGSDGTIYVIGGNLVLDFSSPPSFTNTVLTYATGTNTWASVASMGTSRYIPSVATGADGKIYVIGGLNSGSTHLATGEVYDPATNSWSAIANAPRGNAYGAAATGPDGRIYVMGGLIGSNSGGRTNRAHAYDPVANTWTDLASMPFGRWAHGAVTGADGHIYVIGGHDGSFTASVLMYDVGADSWTEVPSLAVPRYTIQAVLVPGGKIVVAGGYNETPGPTWLGTTETYETIVLCASCADRGNGLIYDADVDITYYDFSFGPTSWSAASTWANNLQVGGFDDWRLPKMKDDSPDFTQTCLFTSYFDDMGPDRGWNKASSELGHLFYEELYGVGLKVLSSDCGAENSTFGLVNGTGPFQNLQAAPADTHYWMSTQRGGHHWSFRLSNGGQGTADDAAAGYAIAVRDGDVLLPANTPPGVDVEVVAANPDGMPSEVSLSFELVTEAGQTTVNKANAGPPAPDDFILGNPPVYYDLTTTASFSGPVTVCIDYSDVEFGNESKGVIPVAILTTADFDATTVDASTVAFGPSGAGEAHGKGHVEDVDHDGDLDMVLHFGTQDTGIACGDTKASLKGETTGGVDIEGSDSVSVKCK